MTKTKKNTSNKSAAKSNSRDIVQLILEDHKPLKKLLKVLKDDERDIEERRAAFEEFAPLLITHAKPEEEVLYAYMKDDEEMRAESFEGEVEHGLAEQMLDEAKNTDDEDLWTARVKVLAELVEHHIEEEEEDLLPDFKKNSATEERLALGEEFLAAKANINGEGEEVDPGKYPDTHPTH